jgi:hypothetical protein
MDATSAIASSCESDGRRGNAVGEADTVRVEGTLKDGPLEGRVTSESATQETRDNKEGASVARADPNLLIAMDYFLIAGPIGT